MSEFALYRRVARRSLHRSRSAAVVIVLVLCILVVAYVGAECVLAAAGRAALWLSPDAAVAALAEPGPLGLVVAAVAAVLGLLLVVVAIAPAHLARHRLADDRMAVIVDDDALAGALKLAALRTAGLPDDRVRVSVGRRSASTRVTPTSGRPLEVAALDAAASEVVASLAPTPGVRTRTTIAPTGVVGA